MEEVSEDEVETHVSRAMREDGAFQEARKRWERRRDRARGTKREEQWRNAVQRTKSQAAVPRPKVLEIQRNARNTGTRTAGLWIAPRRSTHVPH